MGHQTFDKPLPGSGRLERRKRRIARKQGVEAESHQQMLERLEFWRLLRLAVYQAFIGRCAACHMALDFEAPPEAAQSMHTHHLVKKSQGGQDVIENLIALCRDDHKRAHDGRLTISGVPRSLSFMLRTLKGTLVRAWDSIRNEALASSVEPHTPSASTTEPRS